MKTFSGTADAATSPAACAYRSEINATNPGGHFVGTSTTTCAARAGISLPDGVTLTGLRGLRRSDRRHQ